MGKLPEYWFCEKCQIRHIGPCPRERLRAKVDLLAAAKKLPGVRTGTPVVPEDHIRYPALHEAVGSGSPGVMEFAKAILHGDEPHRAWLLEAAECFCAGRPVPPPTPPPEASGSDEKPEAFLDRKAYIREYRRKQRAKAKEAQ